MRHGLFSLMTVMLASAATPAYAAGKLAVMLPLVDADDPGHRLDGATKTLLEESIRAVSGEVLSPQGWTVLDTDNTLSVLADNGIDPTRACEASCSLAAARELKASVFITGTVALSEGEYTAILRLSEAGAGRQLGVVQLEGTTVRDIRRAFGEKAATFFSRIDAATQGQPHDSEAAPPPTAQAPPVTARPPSSSSAAAVAPVLAPKVTPTVNLSLPPAAPASRLPSSIPVASAPVMPSRVVWKAGISGVVIGGAMLVAGLAVGLAGRNAGQSLKTTATPGESVQSEISSANTLETTGVALLGVGGGVALTGGTLMVVGR